MQDRRIHKLRREELLEILLEIERENEQLADENGQLKQRLASRELTLANAGSLAEASIGLSGVFEAAQEAADLYLENIRRMASERDAVVQELYAKAKEECLRYARETVEICKDEIPGAASTSEALERRISALFKDVLNEGGREL